MKEQDFVRIEAADKTRLCDGCAFNDGVSTKCHRPDEFTNNCWDESLNIDYIFKDKVQ